MEDHQLLQALGKSVHSHELAAFRIASLAEAGLAELAQHDLSLLADSQGDAVVRRFASLHFDVLGRAELVGAGAQRPETLTTAQSLVTKIATRVDKLMQLGLALHGLAASAAHRQLPILQGWSTVKVAQVWGQSRTYRDAMGRATGFLSWAWVSNEYTARLQLDVPPCMHPAEWNEGRNLWFRDIAVTRLCAEELGADVASALFPESTHCLVTVREKGTGLQRAIRVPAASRPDLKAWLTAKCE